jgi:hypothetical protein
MVLIFTAVDRNTDESKLSRDKNQFGKFVEKDGLEIVCCSRGHTLRSVPLINGPALSVCLARTDRYPEGSLCILFPQLNLLT